MPQTAAATRGNAREWYARELGRSETALGKKWPEHREWVESYLQTEVLLRLEARGWRGRA